MLIFPLKKRWYEKIKSGEKTVEYREVKLYWFKRIATEIRKQAAFIEDLDMIRALAERETIECVMLPCKLRLGYTQQYMTATITKIEVVNGKDTDLAIDKPVYAIHLTDVSEVKRTPLEKWHN